MYVIVHEEHLLGRMLAKYLHIYFILFTFTIHVIAGWPAGKPT